MVKAKKEDPPVDELESSDDIPVENGILQPYLKFLAASAQEDDDDLGSGSEEARRASTSRSITGSLSESVKTAIEQRAIDEGDDEIAARDRHIQALLGISDTENERMRAQYSTWLYAQVLLQGRIYLTDSRLMYYAALAPPSSRVLNSSTLRIKVPSGITGIRHVYQRYWFVLRQTIFTYHASPNDMYFPQGVIDLSEVIEVSQRPNDETAFSLHRTKGGTIKLKADNANSAHEWIKYLKKEIFRSRVANDYVVIRIPLENVVSTTIGSVSSLAKTLRLTVVADPVTKELRNYTLVFFNNGDPIISSIKDHLESIQASTHKPVFFPDGQLDLKRSVIGKVHFSVYDTVPSEARPARTLDSGLIEYDKPWTPSLSTPTSTSTSASTSIDASRATSPEATESSQNTTNGRASRTHSQHQSRTHSLNPSLSSVLGSGSNTSSAAQSPSLTPSRTPRESDSSLVGCITSKIKGLMPEESSSMLPVPLPFSSLPRNVSAATLSKIFGEKDDSELSDEALEPSETTSDNLGKSEPDAPEECAALSDSEDDDDAAAAAMEDPGVADIRHQRVTLHFRSRFGLGPRSHLIAAFLCTLRHRPPSGQSAHSWRGKFYVANTVIAFRHVSALTGYETRLIVPLTDLEEIPEEVTKTLLLPVSQAGAGMLQLEFKTTAIRSEVRLLVNAAIGRAHQMESEAAGGILSGYHRDAERSFVSMSLRSARMVTYEAAINEKLQASIPPVIFDPFSTEFQEEFLQKPMKELRITMLTIGSRGDVQPYIALALGLKAEGHRCRIASHGEYKDWVEGFGIEFAPIAGDPAALMNIMIEHGSFSVSFLKDAASKFRNWVGELLESAWLAIKDDTDLLIEAPQAMAGLHIAERLQIPYFRSFTMPWTRTRTYPHAFIVPDQHMGGSYNYFTYVLFDNLFWRGTAGQINKWRKSTLGLPPTSLEGMRQQEIPFLYSVSPTVLVPPVDQPDWVHYTGYWELPAHGHHKKGLDPALKEFIQKARNNNKKVVYIGFGSILVSDATEMTRTIVEAIKETELSCVLARGWSQRKSGEDKSTSDASNEKTESEQKELLCGADIFEIDAAPHDLLFPLLDAVVHHGGSGSTGMSLRCGKPTVIKPFFGDQYFYAHRVEDIGAGIHLPKLEKDALVSALKRAITDERIQKRAKLVGEQISHEHGVDMAIRAIYRELPYAADATKTRTRPKSSFSLLPDSPRASQLFNLPKSQAKVYRRGLGAATTLALSPFCRIGSMSNPLIPKAVTGMGEWVLSSLPQSDATSTITSRSQSRGVSRSQSRIGSRRGSVCDSSSPSQDTK